MGALDLEELIRNERKRDITSEVRLPSDVTDSAIDNIARHTGQEKFSTNLGFGGLTLGSKMDSLLRDWPHLIMKENGFDSGPVASMKLSPDGTRIGATHNDSTVRLWQTKDGELLNHLQSGGDMVTCVAFSPDSTRIVGGSVGGWVLAWEAIVGGSSEPTLIMEGHGDAVSSIAYAPNGKFVASGSLDLTVKVWNASTGDCLHTLADHLSAVVHVVFTPDSKQIVSSADARGQIWNADTGAFLAFFEGHRGAIWALAVSHGGDRVATGSEDGTCRIWDAASGAELVTIAEHTTSVWSVAWAHDDKAVVSGSCESASLVSDSYSGNTLHQLTRDATAREDASDTVPVSWSSVGAIACSGSGDGHVKLWDTNNGTLIAEYQGHTEKVNQVQFSPDGRDVFSSSDDGSIRKWKVLDVLRLY